MFDLRTAGGLGPRLRTWFPEREFFMRSEGQVRFIRISTRVQAAAAAAVAAALLAWGGSMAAVAWSEYAGAAERAALQSREARVATSEERLDAYRADIREVRDDLARRQTFLEDMVASLPDDVKNADTTKTGEEAAQTVTKVGAALPEARGLAEVEARQLALVDRLTKFADGRAARAAAALKTLGLDPFKVLDRTSHEAMGGPLEQYATDRNGGMDPRFERLGLSLARMSALERGLEGVPQVLPASFASISSGFGYRRDPFNGRGAMHAGLDFRGATGTPILAAAKGRVSFVGRRSGYGNVVEIDHGNGLMTRYAHMSAFRSKVGQMVEAGQPIGAIGSTGRSTGPHLHFEVRINGRAVNPRPFLERAPDVLEEIRRPSRLASN